MINLFGVSGGKDSTALLLWAVHESGYDPASIRVTFANTGNESPVTMDYIAMLREKVFPIEELTPELDFYALAEKKGIFPSAKRRFCTTDLKLKPTQEYIHSLWADGFDVLSHSGVRTGESFDRAKLPKRDIDTYFGCEVFRPLLHWSIDDVWAIHDRHGIPRNPLYAMGAKRVGCWPCVMSNKAEIRNIGKRDPARVAFLKEQEVRVTASRPELYRSFFHSRTVPKGQHSISMERDGKKIGICTIEDVFRWATTAHGGQQYDMDFGDEPVSCSHSSGACE